MLIRKSAISNIFTEVSPESCGVPRDKLKFTPNSRVGATPVDLGEIEFQYYQTAMKDVLIENTGSYLEVMWRHVIGNVRDPMFKHVVCGVWHI